jgi:hypothetical protein
MPIITGLLAALQWSIARRLGAGRRWATVIAVGAIFGTYALPYGRELFSEPLTTLGIAIALERVLAGRFAAAGLGMALAFTSRPETILLLPVFSLTLLAFRVPLRANATFTAVASGGVLVDALYNLARFGNVTSTGYVGEGFTTPFLHGATGLLFGANKSLFVFAPIMVLLLVLAARGLLRREMYATLASETFLLLFVAAALWHSWQGGWSWGPRLLLPGVLCLTPLLARARRPERRAAVALLAVGFLVSASTVIVQTDTQQLDRPQPVNGPSLIRQYALIPHIVSYSANHIHAREFGGITRRYVALWQVNAWRALGTTGLLVAVVASLLLLAALAAVLRALRPGLVRGPPLLPCPRLWRHA